jgi:competence protein ComFC
MIFRCILCELSSLSLICGSCQSIYLSYSITRRSIESGLDVYSFYPYSEIEKLIKTKHSYHGYNLFKILAKNSFLQFVSIFKHSRLVYAIPIDDIPSPYYSHTAILASSLSSKSIKPIFNSLKAQSKLTYSSRSLPYRKSNPRGFKYSFKDNVDVILVDDIVTTGTTLSEAHSVLKVYNVNVLLALTLADARL